MQEHLWSLIVSGTVLGFWAGIAPGPLLTLVITETLCLGPRAGAKVAAAPLITDFPIIAVTVFVLAGMSQVSGLLAGVSFAGAGVLLWLAWDSFTTTPPEVEVGCRPDHSLGKGVLTNFLNPHPYLFWLTVGAPLLFSAHEAAGVLGPILFLAAFYVVLVGAKLGVALLTARSRSFLTSRVYVWLLRGLGLLLVLFAFRFLHEGWVLLAG